MADHLGVHSSSGLRVRQSKVRESVPEGLAPAPSQGRIASVLLADVLEILGARINTLNTEEAGCASVSVHTSGGLRSDSVAA